MTAKALCWRLITTRGGLVLGTTHDEDVVVTATGYTGTYAAATGITGSNIAMKGDLSVGNTEVKGALATFGVKAIDIEAGLYDGAQVVLFEVDWTDPSTVTPLKRGFIGNITRTFEGGYTAEVLDYAQKLSQPIGESFSTTCRNRFGDARCTLDLTPYTFAGTVDSVAAQDQWADASLTQTGITVAYSDPSPQPIPTGPYQIQAVPPAGGDWVSDLGVSFADGTALTYVSGTPAVGQYHVDSAGLYTFAAADQAANRAVILSYNFSYGYFDEGTVTWLTGANAGYQMEVRSFSPGVVKLFLPMVNTIEPGDTYSIVAGCNKLIGTCRTRFLNILNFTGEPNMPGRDALARVLQAPAGGIKK